MSYRPVRFLVQPMFDSCGGPAGARPYSIVLTESSIAHRLPGKLAGRGSQGRKYLDNPPTLHPILLYPGRILRRTLRHSHNLIEVAHDPLRHNPLRNSPTRVKCSAAWWMWFQLAYRHLAQLSRFPEPRRRTPQSGSLGSTARQGDQAADQVTPLFWRIQRGARFILILSVFRRIRPTYGPIFPRVRVPQQRELYLKGSKSRWRKMAAVPPPTPRHGRAVGLDSCH